MTRPGGGELGRGEVEKLHLFRIDPPMVQSGQQAVVGGGDEGRGDPLADQVLWGANAGPIARHQGFTVAQP